MKFYVFLVALCTPFVLAAGAERSGDGIDHIFRQGIRNIDMSQQSGNEAETAVAISHTDPRRITSVSNLETNGLFHSWSVDGGHTWQHDTIATGSDSLTAACCDAQLASDDFGNIFLTYLSSAIDVKMAISIDGFARCIRRPASRRPATSTISSSTITGVSGRLTLRGSFR